MDTAEPLGEVVATVIAGEGAKLSPADLKRFAQQAEKAGAKDVHTSWLAKGVAADILGRGIGIDTLRGALSGAIGTASLDVIVQPEATRRKKLLLADMESTVIEQELLDELAAIVGIGDKVIEITRRAMNGELDFAAALRERVALLKGHPAKILDEAAKEITFMPGAAALVATMKAHGAQTWLVTGGFSYFARPVAVKLGFDRSHANELVVRDGMITGVVAEPILDRNGKKVLLAKACMDLNLSPADCLAVGDGANDVPMLEACNKSGGLGVAFCAKPKVRAAVPNQINYGDLTALLYAQGYSEADFS